MALKWMRDQFKILSPVLWLVILVFVLLVFVDYGSVNVDQPRGGPADAVATVGDRSVSQREFELAYRGAQERWRSVYGDQFTPELERQIGLPFQVLDGLVGQKILLAEAERAGLGVSDEELRRAILRVFSDETGRFVGEEQYQRYVRYYYGSASDFERAMRQDLLVDKLRSILRESVYVSADEVEEAYRGEVERASIRYLQLPGDRFADQVVVSDQDLETYFAGHAEDYRLPERREVAYLLLDKVRLRDLIQVNDEEVRAYYDGHPDEFVQPEQVRARHILVMSNDNRPDAEARRLIAEARRRIEGGEDFGAVAAQVSEDPGSKGQGGDLGFFGRGQMAPEFEAAAFAAQPGQLVEAQTSFGHHLIEVTERREGGSRPFEEAAGEIRRRLVNERIDTEGEARATALRLEVLKTEVQSPEDLRRFAEQRPELTFDEPPAFGQNELVAGLGRVPAVSAAAFALEPGGLSELVRLPRGWAILYLKSVQPPRTPELEEVRPQVRQAVQRERQLELALARLRTAQDAVEGGKSLDQVAAELDLTVQESGEFGRGGAIPGLGADAEIVGAALNLDEGQLGGPFTTGASAVLFQVSERQRWTQEGFESSQPATRARLEEGRLEQVLASLIEQRKRDLGVNYSRSFVERYGQTG